MPDNNGKYRNLKAVGWLTQFGLNMVSPIILCIAAALWIKSRFNTGDWVMLLALVLGVSSSVLNMAMFIQSVNKETGGGKDDQKRED